eukprot:15431920-Alexandrium_andersonii.AAC.1
MCPTGSAGPRRIGNAELVRWKNIPSAGFRRDPANSEEHHNEAVKHEVSRSMRFPVTYSRGLKVVVAGAEQR